MKKPHINNPSDYIYVVMDNGAVIMLPVDNEKYKLTYYYDELHDVLKKRIDNDFSEIVGKIKMLPVKKEELLSEQLFHDINQKVGKPGALLKGLRYRENLYQKAFSERIGVKQGDLSKMENGKRPIGKQIAQRLEKEFGTDHKLFLIAGL